MNEPSKHKGRFWWGFCSGALVMAFVAFAAYGVVMPSFNRAVEYQHEHDCRQQCPGCEVHLRRHP